jgi:hypothetical protein
MNVVNSLSIRSAKPLSEKKKKKRGKNDQLNDFFLE